jgi:hypothetical protein
MIFFFKEVDFVFAYKVNNWIFCIPCTELPHSHAGARDQNQSLMHARYMLLSDRLFDYSI